MRREWHLCSTVFFESFFLTIRNKSKKRKNNRRDDRNVTDHLIVVKGKPS